MKRATKRKLNQGRPAIRSNPMSYLFEQAVPTKRRADRELQLICRSVIELECQYRILGTRNQDPVAILSAAMSQNSMHASTENIIDFYGKFYDRIQQLDKSGMKN